MTTICHPWCFRSELEKDESSALIIMFRKLYSSQAWVVEAVLPNAGFCWKVHDTFMKVCWRKGSQHTETFSLYTLAKAL